MSPDRRHSAEMGPHASSMGDRTQARASISSRRRSAMPGAIADDLADALNAADIAAVLLRLEDGDERTLIERIKTLRILIQSATAPRSCSTAMPGSWRAPKPTARI